MKILMLSNCEVVETQGSGYIIINTLNSLKNLGHDVTIIPPSELDYLPGWQGRARVYRMAIGMGRWMFRKRKQLNNFDLIIVYGAESALAVFYIKKILKLKTPIVLHSNGLEVHVNERMNNVQEVKDSLKWYNFDQSWIYRYCYRNVDMIITLSKFDRDYAVDTLGLPETKLEYIEPCLPEVFFNYPPADPITAKPIIVYCGTWITRKGVELIQEAVPRILAKYPEYKFRIIGVGNQFSADEHFSTEILPRVEVFPLVKQKEKLIELYREAEIFLFPSIHESFGLVVAEAMRCGCAVITGHSGYAANLRDSEEAIILKELTKEEVYEALESIITDFPFRAKLSRQGAERTEVLRWINFQAKLDQVLRDVTRSTFLSTPATN